ncbi:MAG: anaerobic sulfatase maturase [Promethearchaeia archaeon]
MKQFQLLIKPASFDCNLYCRYCFYLRVCKEYPKIKHPRMSEDVLETMISKFLSFRFKESIFGWQGGEPTLMGLKFFEKVVELQQKYGETGQVIGNALQTNGILLDENWAKFLSKYKFLVGISLDGPKEMHDKYRRSKKHESVWSKVMQATEVLKQHQVNFNILCVLSKANINRVQKLYNFFLAHDFHHVQFIPTLELNREGKIANFCVSPRQYGKFLTDLFDLWIKNPQEMHIRIFNSILSQILDYPRGYCALNKKCGEYMVIEWNGDVYPCDFFVNQEYKLGNFKENTFSGLKQRRNEQFMDLKGNLPKECSDCKWLKFCHGGCVKDRKTSNMKEKSKTYFCEGYKLFFENTYRKFLNYAKFLKNQGM